MKKHLVIMSLAIGMLFTGCQSPGVVQEEVAPLPFEEQTQETDPYQAAEELMQSIVGKSISTVLPEDEAEVAQSMLGQDDTYFLYLTHGCPHCQEFVRQLGEDSLKRNVVLLLPEGMTDEYIEAFPGVERYKGATIVPAEDSVISQVIRYVPSMIVVDPAGNIKQSTSNNVTYEGIKDNFIDK